MRRAVALAAVSALLVIGAIGAGTASPAPAPLTPVIVTMKSQPSLGGIGGSRAARLREVIRRRQAGADASFLTFRQRLAAWRLTGKAGDVTRFWVFNGFALSATQEVIDALAADPAVARVTPDANAIVPAWSGPVEQNISRVGAPALWDLGVSGQGVVVASLDSGVNMAHPDLSGRWRGGTNSWYDPFNQHPATPLDRSGHGTQVMGVMVGGSAGGSAIGMAPGARWIAARIFNDAGQSSLSTTHLALQWVLDPDHDPATADAPQVVNNSWSFASGGCNLEFAPDIQALRAAGIVPVFAAGNFGGLSASPANNPGALAVGSTTASDTIAGDSSRGPSACGEPSSTFPEITAPGVNILTSDLWGFYTGATGTSMAAPHVSGALALLVAASPGLTVAQQEAALMQTAVDLGAPGPDNTFGYGRLDVLAAYQSLAAPPPPSDATGPVVTGVGATPSPIASGTVALTATATDVGGTTVAAEWFEGADPGAGNGTAMTAADGAFDGVSEGLRADVDAAALAPGTHTLSVRARDLVGNWGAPVTTTLVVDRTGPVASAVTATPSPVGSGTVTLSATAADAASTVAGAEWFEGADPGAGSGTAMTASDGAFGAATEGVTAGIPAAGLSAGSHTLSVRARDALGNWGDAVTTTLVVNRTGPVASAVTATPSPVGSGTVTLSATAADAASTVAGAEWFEGADPGAGSGTAMTASDGAFGAATEGVTAGIPAAGLSAGSHTLSVRARDALGNWGDAVTTTILVDHAAPGVSAVAVSPTPTLGAPAAVLTAAATDPSSAAAPATGVAGAEWFEGADPGAGHGTAMTAADGAFGAPAESLTASIPTAGMSVGAHVLTVRARDAVGNWGPGGSVTLTVSTSNAIFSDGFESGGLGAWPLVSGGPSRIAVTAAARRDGAYGMQATISGNTPSYVQDATPANESSYVASFALNPNGVNIKSATTTIFTGLSGGASPSTLFQVQMRRITGPVRYQLRLSVARKGGSTATGWFTLAGGFRTVRITWASGTSTSASLAIDGVTQQTLTRLDTSAKRLETVRLGPSAGLASGMAGTEYFDSFSSTR